MPADSLPDRHPGPFVRETVIPPNMSVTEAASRLGIGRPALSNFLNGNSALSAEMAVRLEKTFGANRQKLIDMQTEYDRQERHAEEKGVAVRAFVPAFLTIRARQIEAWPDGNLDARSRLPVFLRKLIHSTGSELHQVDFPGYDNAERKGSDGFVEAGAATPWIPSGRSYWEFGTDERPAKKANKDYAARLKTVDPDERKDSSFIFVTPRNWPGKTAWAKEKNEAGEWKAVRAFDASDLEQWLEISVTGQIWFAEQIGLPANEYETLEQAWKRWAHGSEPHLTAEIFAPSIAAYKKTFRDWIEKPSARQFVITADSRDEALAFLACLFDDPKLRRHRDIAAIFMSPKTVRKLIASSVPFIPIAYDEEVEAELSDAYRRLHCIVFRPRNAVDTDADISLDLLSETDFSNALQHMGVDDSSIARLSRESGRSPTILRRRLSNNKAISKPAWSGDEVAATKLVPISLIGAWHAESKADREIAAFLADRNYDVIENDIARLRQFDDSPVWSAGRYRGVASKTDALFAIANMVTPPDIERFFLTAEYVLSESDPALELCEEDRWAAPLHGKERDHSGALRNGICETLVILSVHGNNLFRHRLGIDVEVQVASLIRKILTPLTLEKLLSNDHDLPHYAEAAPDEFLKIVEEDLKKNNPVVFGLLKPVDSSMFGATPARTGLLWALECLAWRPQNLPRVSAILAQLARPKIDDNWMNRPDASLQAIFRSWMPQTAASVDQRIKALKRLIKKYPEIGWQICIEQIKPGSRFGSNSYRPRWRSDASGAGQVVTRNEVHEFNRAVLDFLIDWPSHNEDTIGDLVFSLQGMPEDDENKVWNVIDEWSRQADETAKAALRERIRRFAFTRRGQRRKLDNGTRAFAQEAYEKLKPKDTVIRNSWLFAAQWLELSAVEIEDESLNLRQRDERIDRLRRDAMIEIWSERELDGIKELLATSDAAGTVGRYLATCITSVRERVDFVRRCLAIEGALRANFDRCLQGFLHAISNDPSGEGVLIAVAENVTNAKRIQLFLNAPFRASTWRVMDAYGENLCGEYWKNVVPSWISHTSTELTEIIDCLLNARRPRAAFHAVHMDFDEIETSRLKRLMRDVATVNAEQAGHYKLERYYISEGLKSLNGRVGVTRDEMAQLEFLYIDALDDSEHGIPNLESQIANSPAVYVQAIALAYKRDDIGEDPPEWRIEDPEQRAVVALAAHRLLDQINMVPGTNDSGKIDPLTLTEWLVEVRRICREHARAEIGDHCIGQLLAKSPANENGVWPCEAVCEVMEEIAAPEIGRGFFIGTLNSRGTHWRGKGGDQERELAAKYRGWAEQLHFEYPYIGGLLEDIARSYDRDAGWWDSEERINQRLRD